MAVQGWQVGQHSRHARVALTVLTIPLFVAGLVGDGLVESATATFWCSGVSAAVLTLWLGPARVWFGDASPTLLRSAPPTARPTAPPTPSRPGVPEGQGPPPPASFPLGTPPHERTTSVSTPLAPWVPPVTSAYDAQRPRAARRPRALLWACILTWVCTGLAIAGLGVSLAMLGHDSDSLLDQMYRQNPQLAEQGLSRHTVLAMVVAISAVVLVAAAAAAVFAVLLYLHHHWAWYALVVSACLAALLFLIGSFGSPIAIVLLGACVATIACLARPEVKAWLGR
jgi:hypothetical protein